MDKSDIEMQLARENLKKRFAGSQTGGKGSVRRKKKANNVHIVNTRLNPEEKEYNDIIDEVNQKISGLSGDRYELWDIYLNDYMIEIGTEFRKKDFKKDSKFNTDYMKENYENFFYEYLLRDSNSKQLFKKEFKFMKNQFSENGYLYLLGNIRSFIDVIDKEEYIESKEEEDVIENIDQYYEILGLEKDKIPEKTEIKKAYLKKSAKVHPDKHPDEYDKYTTLFQEVQGAYKILLKYYYPGLINNSAVPDIS